MVLDRRSRVQVTRIGIETTKLWLWAIARKRFKRFGKSQSSCMTEIFCSMKLPRLEIILKKLVRASNHYQALLPRRIFWQIGTFHRRYRGDQPRTTRIACEANQQLAAGTLGIPKTRIPHLRCATDCIEHEVLLRMPRYVSRWKKARHPKLTS